MTESEFRELLLAATDHAIGFAKRYVVQDLPSSAKYHVLLNQSFDGYATADEVVYPQDDGREISFASADEVVALLYRDGRCPEWIDVAVEAAGPNFTLVRLLCCGRFTDDLEKMYYRREGRGPFGIKSPDLPPGYVEGSRFEIRYVGEQ